MKYNFDKIVDRSGTSAMKHERYPGEEIIPMWVADMDFESAEPIIEALHERIDHRVFGYTTIPDKLYDLVIARLEKQFGWSVKKEWIVFQADLVNGITSACRTFGGYDKEVLVMVPSYPPFLKVPENSGNKLVTVPLIEKNKRSSLDFDAIRAAITEKTFMIVLCNPHNPTGTVFTKEELVTLNEICLEHNIIVNADEIHCDFILDEDKKHIPFASISQSAQENSITFMAPSKTYNIPGLRSSFAIIPNDKLRLEYVHTNLGITCDINCLGYAATIAAYEKCDDWLDELVVYLRKNRDYLTEKINEIPELSVNHIEATYLAWIDISKTGIEDPKRFFEKAGVGLMDGRLFAAEGYVRINYGCPFPVLKMAMTRIQAAFKKR